MRVMYLNRPDLFVGGAVGRHLIWESRRAAGVSVCEHNIDPATVRDARRAFPRWKYVLCACL